MTLLNTKHPTENIRAQDETHFQSKRMNILFLFLQ